MSLRLPNIRGSCWVNSCIQAIIQIPNVSVPLLSEIVKMGGSIDSLMKFFEKVRTLDLPAGSNIGDAHELFLRVCDLTPELEKLCSYTVCNITTCAVNRCGNVFTSPDETRTEFVLHRYSDFQLTLANRIVSSMNENILDWKCDKNQHSKTVVNTGCIKQTYIKTFPKVFVFHTDNGLESYPESIDINKRKYKLVSGICFHNAHWWAFGRNSHNEWVTFNDMEIVPMTISMNAGLVRMLIYYRYED